LIAFHVIIFAGKFAPSGGSTVSGCRQFAHRLLSRLPALLLAASTRPGRLGAALLLLAAGPAVPRSAFGETVLVPAGGSWRYLDDGSDQGTAWRLPAYDDSLWATGPAQLGYGEGDEATVVSYGPDPQNKYITTYFRHTFSVADPGALTTLSLDLLRDDGAIVYLNGVEVRRENMPGGVVTYLTHASHELKYVSRENLFMTTALDPAVLVAGANVLAVEIHQVNGATNDAGFDLRLVADPVPAAVRGPYLQRGAPTEVTVRWRSNVLGGSAVRYGPDPQTLEQEVELPTSTGEHEVVIGGIEPETRYYYSVVLDGETISGGDAEHYFETAPPAGARRPVRIWVIGDSGTGESGAQAVRNAYLADTAGAHTDLWLMLGDNAYWEGTDLDHRVAVFDTYPMLLRSSFLWPTIGNHDVVSASSTTQSGPYYEVFSLPKLAEAGGLASGTEAYYSFDFANLHFISLNSEDVNRSTGGAMLTWLTADLAATQQDWIVAFWHSPPYSKGSHDSDVEINMIQMRENAGPILEAGGVDLVLAGHSHNYERSFLLDGHYGTSETLTSAMILDGGDGSPVGDGAYTKPSLGPSPHEGAVYVVAGSSSVLRPPGQEGPLDHPAMAISLNLLGSVVIEVDGNRLDYRFLDPLGVERDRFRIIKGGSPSLPSLSGHGLASLVIVLLTTTGLVLSGITPRSSIFTKRTELTCSRLPSDRPSKM